MKILQNFLKILQYFDDNILFLLIKLIQFYQKTISPDHGMIQTISRQHCRFFPTCSDYAIQSLRQYGLVYGTMFSLKRIARCNPLCMGGYDPISIK